MERVIWMCWLQGWDKAPPVARACLNSWIALNPGWTIKPVDTKSVRELVELPNLSGKQITPTALSDLVRIHLLQAHGGIWVDATVLCRRPLDDWFPDVFGEGFFAFDKPGGDRPLSTWFLAANRDHPLAAAWKQSAVDYWIDRKAAHQYFWFHELFAVRCCDDASFSEAWSRVPKISARGPHLAQRVGLGSQHSAAIREVRDHPAPMYKLTRKHNPALLGLPCVLSDLLGDYATQLRV